MTRFFAVLLASAICGAAEYKLLDVRKIWDQAPHNAFTDLIYYKGRWICAFREGAAHVSPDGSIRVIASRDGGKWESAALIGSGAADLRDAKLSIAPDGRLMLLAAGALHQPAAAKHESMVWFSSDGGSWTGPVKVGDPNVWLWRVTWNAGMALGVGYDTMARGFVRLYRGNRAAKFETLAPSLFERGYPNESSIVFLPDNTALCLLRRDEGTRSGQLGRARPPYTDWTWQDLGVRIGGPQMIRLPDGALAAAVRLYDGKTRTALCSVDAAAGKLKELLTLPSGGDTSYAGMVHRKGVLWVSYYSSHEGKTSIYLARVRPGTRPRYR